MPRGTRGQRRGLSLAVATPATDRGAWRGKISFKAELTGSDGSRYRYHGHAMELYAGQGNDRRLGMTSNHLSGVGRVRRELMCGQLLESAASLFSPV